MNAPDGNVIRMPDDRSNNHSSKLGATVYNLSVD